MTSEPEQNLPSTPTTPPADPAPAAQQPQQPEQSQKSQPSRPPMPRTGPTLPGNPSEAWDQIRHTAETTTRRLNEFRQHNQSPADLQATARQFAERGREETGRGLRALAEAAGRLADLVDGTAGSPGRPAQEPPVLESKKPDAGPDRPA